jgi:hypothetical protein
MTKILIPIPVNKRLPEIKAGESFSGCVIVRFINKKVSDDFSALTFAYCDSSGKWEDAMPKNEKFIRFKPEGAHEVVEWYQETELESLFPDKDISYNVANNASENRINGTMLHQEGQTFVQNHILKEIKK